MSALMETRHMRTFVALSTIGLLLALYAPSGHGARDFALAGRWQLNNELSHEVQPAPRKGGLPGIGGVRPSVSVGGLPVPLPGGGTQAPVSSGPSKDPMVLQSAEFTIEPVGDELRLTYHGIGQEQLLRGNDKGTVSRWSDRKLRTRYQTTSRTVSRTYELRKDGRMLVTVTIKPNRSATTVYKRVFDRVP